MIWQYQPTSTEVVEVCTGDYIDTSPVVDTPRWTDQNLKIHSVNVGDSYEISFDIQSRSYLWAAFYDNNDNRIGAAACAGTYPRNYSSVCATGVVPAGATYLRTAIHRYGNRNGSLASATYKVPGSCVLTSQPVAASSDWVSGDEIDNVSQIEAIECELDDGVHGKDATGESHARYSGNQSPTNQPRYVSNPNNSNAVNWASNSVPERYIVPGNYHDYLQSDSASLLGGVTVQSKGRLFRSGGTLFCGGRYRQFCRRWHRYLSKFR